MSINPDAFARVEAITGDLERISALLNTCCADTQQLFAPLMAEIISEIRAAYGGGENATRP